MSVSNVVLLGFTTGSGRHLVPTLGFAPPVPLPEVFKLPGRYGIRRMTGACALAMPGRYGFKTLPGHIREEPRS